MNDKNEYSVKQTEKEITRLPGFLLTIKGRIDGKKDKLVVDAYVQKLWEKTLMVEKKYAIITEKCCESIRKKGADDLLFLINKESGQEEAAKIRDDRSKEAAKRDVIQINEDLLAKKVMLEKAIIRTEHTGISKINSYLYGVRKKLKDYKMDALESTTLDEYIRAHQEIDDAIEDFAYSSIRNGDAKKSA